MTLQWKRKLIFEKLAYIDRLIKAGTDGAQARALDEALKESIGTKAISRASTTKIERV